MEKTTGESGTLTRKIKTALISSFDKKSLHRIADIFRDSDIEIFATGGTAKLLSNAGLKVIPTESLTSFNELLNGRIKTLHPAIFYGLLSDRHEEEGKYTGSSPFPLFDLLYVDLYPFGERVNEETTEQEAIELIDIGGISMLRAGAKNYMYVTVVPGKKFIGILELLKNRSFITDHELRKKLAVLTFYETSKYDAQIFNYLVRKLNLPEDRYEEVSVLRYGENPHQRAFVAGIINEVILPVRLSKRISYNNLLDISAGIGLLNDLKKSSKSRKICVIIKHTNACGVGMDEDSRVAMEKALKGDEISAYGGILITDFLIGEKEWELLAKRFFEIVCAPEFDNSIITRIPSTSKKNLIKYRLNLLKDDAFEIKYIMGGGIFQDCDTSIETIEDMEKVCVFHDITRYIDDINNCWIIAKHLRSNAIAIFKCGQLLSASSGFTSRIDAIKWAITKAADRNHDIRGAVLASDGFFPFTDCVEQAFNAGIDIIIAPSGSIRDNEIISYCQQKKITLLMPRKRHFKH